MFNPFVQFTKVVLEGTVKTTKPISCKYDQVEAATDFAIYVPTVDAEWIPVKENHAEIRKVLDEKFGESPDAGE